MEALKNEFPARKSLQEFESNFQFVSSGNGDIFAIKKSQTDSKSTEIHILSAAANYQQFSLQTGTCLHETGVNFTFLVAANKDVYAIKRSETGTHSTEVHILSAADNYQRFSLQTGTCLHETEDNFSFLLAPNNDLIAIKQSRTGTNSTEIHILSAADNYQRFSLQTGTGLHETDRRFAFLLTPKGDICAIKKEFTGTRSTEVHILSAASGFKEFSLHTGTCLHETIDNFEFLMDDKQNIIAIKKCATGTHSTEVHILSAGNNYQNFSKQTGTCLHETARNVFRFLLAGNGDIYAIKQLHTGTNSTEIHILSAASNYQRFSLQTGTCLHETDRTFDFLLAPNGDLYALKKSITDSHTTEVHILSAADSYQKFSLHTGTCLHETDDTFTFTLGTNNDIYAIKKRNTDTNSTEVHVLSAANNYQHFSLQTGTCLHINAYNFDFGMDHKNNLYALKKRNTDSNSTEVHVLSADSKYQAFSLHTPSALHETFENFSLLVAGNGDLCAIKKNDTGTHSTEVHKLSASNTYQSFSLHTGTCLHETDVDF